MFDTDQCGSAGATFMAAGTSSPELFIALLALGQPDDAMGMGTVVGSGIPSPFLSSSLW
tara:strand:- start:971 stop:1147 length:177 start_codon:yes stop_codon:yes gene_type:complete